MRKLIALGLLIAAPVAALGDVAVTPDQQLAAARADVARASADEQRLAAEASQAANEAERLAGEQLAAAASIGAAEARIDVAQVQLALARGAAAQQQRRLAERQAPVAALLAGLISMGRRPPLLALADGSPEEFVRVRALLDATMPIVRARTAGLAQDLARAHSSELAAAAARDSLTRERAGLDQQRARFAELERQALSRQAQLTGQALGAGDVTLSGGEAVATLGSEASRRSAALAQARRLAQLAPPPSRPTRDDSRAADPPLAYQLPVDSPLVSGLGSIDVNGIRSRGLTLASGRGAGVFVPADGTIAFSGPFRRSDGVVIIDHGGGWLSLLVNVASTLPKGSRVRRGDPLGRALGRVEVSLSRGGANVSPAFIAASSAMLSNTNKRG